MEPKFDILFLEEVIEFLEHLDEKSREKIIYNIDKSRYINNPKLFKKLTSLIWEFRTVYQKKQYRILAFWDKGDKKDTLVITTHGFVKKTGKVASKEIKKAEEIRRNYFDDKS